MKLKISDFDRKYLADIRALTADISGREILVGLTWEESEFYISYSEKNSSSEFSEKDQEKYLALHEKHEAHRVAIISSEVELREEQPQQH